LIVERKRAEAELVKAHDLLATTVASTGDAVTWILNPKSANLTISKLRSFGLS